MNGRFSWGTDGVQGPATEADCMATIDDEPPEKGMGGGILRVSGQGGMKKVVGKNLLLKTSIFFRKKRRSGTNSCMRRKMVFLRRRTLLA